MGRFACFLMMLLAAPLAAQEPADSAASADSTERPRPQPRRPAHNPYLREVPDHEAVPPSTRDAHRRGAFWASIGGGAGAESVRFDAPGTSYSATRTRPTLTAGIGGTLGQFMRIGLEGFVWFNPHGDGFVETISTVGVGARIYPFPRAGLYFHASGGLGYYNVEDVYDPCGCYGPVIADWGGAWSLGGGLELPVGRGIWLGPMVEVIHVDMVAPVDYRERVVHFGLSLTFDGH